MSPSSLRFLISFTGLTPIVVLLFSLFSKVPGSDPQMKELDSLQTLIRKEVGAGTNHFLPLAIAYDSIAQSSGDTLRMGKGKNFLGMYSYLTGNHERAIEYYLAALPFFIAVRDTYYIGMMNNNIGAAYEYRKEPEQSISYYKNALASFTLLKDTLWMANVLNNIAIQLNVAERNEESLEHFIRAKALYSTLHDSSTMATLLTNMAECYRLSGRYTTAINMEKEYLDNYKNFHTTDVVSNAYAALGRSYLALHQLEEAKKYNDLSIKIRKENKFQYLLSNNYEVESGIYEKEGNYKQALVSFKNFKASQDSMLNKEKDDRITQLTTEYGVKEKDQKISLLNTQNELNTLRIEKSNRQKLLYGIVALSFIICALALYYLLNLKSKTNKALAEKNEIISKALSEKDILLREIHHRVKNNLQMISALLYLHGKSVDDASAQEALMESQNRVQSMAMIHQNLYQNDNLLGVSVKDYLDKLMNHLISSYNIEQERIRINKVIDITHVDVDTVIPLALIINELISNALKYAFRDGRKGIIDIFFGERNGDIVLEIKDNGPGLPKHVNKDENGNFGFKLINILTERLGATWTTESKDGTKVTLVVPQKKAA